MTRRHAQHAPRATPRALTGTEGPGTGVDWVTVVTARGNVEDIVVVMVLEPAMFPLSPCVLSASS